jgi:hypothetical protein
MVSLSNHEVGLTHIATTSPFDKLPMDCIDASFMDTPHCCITQIQCLLRMRSTGTDG